MSEDHSPVRLCTAMRSQVTKLVLYGREGIAPCDLGYHNMAQRWMELDDFNHEFPHTPDVGLHVWVEVVGDDGDVDGQTMTVNDWYWR